MAIPPVTSGCKKGVVRRVGIKVVIDPIAVRIFVRQIRLSSRAHDFRWVETLSLARSATLKHPMQDASPFSPELFGQLRVALVSRNGHRERDQVHAPLDGLVDRPQTRLVTACDHQLELWLILEKILMHEPCGDCISTRHAFDFGLSPAPTFLDFVNSNQTRSTQHGQVCWAAVAHGDDKSLWVSGLVIVAQDLGYRVALTIGARPLQEEHGVSIC